MGPHDQFRKLFSIKADIHKGCLKKNFSMKQSSRFLFYDNFSIRIRNGSVAKIMWREISNSVLILNIFEIFIFQHS